VDIRGPCPDRTDYVKVLVTCSSRLAGCALVRHVDLGLRERRGSTRRDSSEEVFVHPPTNTVCGDTPVEVPMVALEERSWNARRSA
jgi:hypothetical protein